MTDTESAIRAAHELRVVFSRLRRRLREVASEQDLTPPQTSVLSRLDKEGASTASALATVEGVRPQSMATTLGALAQRGLIERRPDPLDGRRQVVRLTAAGRDRVEGDRQAREEWLARALRERYRDDELRIIVEALALLDRLSRP
jgi:DNA-binding MarR family transcriptional regulator